MSVETALSYAALILADADVEITAENLATLTSNANVSVEKIWSDIYAKALEGKDLKELFFNFSAAPAAAAPSAAAGGEGEAAPEEAKEEEAKEESDDDMGFGLFD